jgi:hypothetical protein
MGVAVSWEVDDLLQKQPIDYQGNPRLIRRLLSHVTVNPVGNTVGRLPSVPSTQAYHVPETDGVLTYAPHRVELTHA